MASQSDRYESYKWTFSTWLYGFVPPIDSKMITCLNNHRRIMLHTTIPYISLRAGSYTVHISPDLLTFYSDYYRAALNGPLKVKAQYLQPLETTPETLQSFNDWLNTGFFPQTDQQYQRLNVSLLIRLYALGDQYLVIALRRAVLDAIAQRFSGAVSCQSDHRSIPHSDDLALAFQLLPPSSPLCKFLTYLFVCHWGECSDPRQDTLALLTAVGLWHTSRDGSLHWKDQHCLCHHDLCRFHEHESEEERATTCGDGYWVQSHLSKETRAERALREIAFPTFKDGYWRDPGLVGKLPRRAFDITGMGGLLWSLIHVTATEDLSSEDHIDGGVVEVVPTAATDVNLKAIRTLLVDKLKLNPLGFQFEKEELGLWFGGGAAWLRERKARLEMEDRQEAVETRKPSLYVVWDFTDGE